MKAVLLLLLSLVAIATCASSYQLINLGGPFTYAQQKTNAWQRTNVAGGCAHLATYETAAELRSLITAANAVGGPAYTFFLGAEKQPNSNTFIWSVGSRRGTPFFSANVISNYDTTHSYYDINFESGFICHQEYCFEPHRFEGYKLVYDALSESLLFSYGASEFTVNPASSSVTSIYLAIELEQPNLLPNAEGGSLFQVFYTKTAYYDANKQANSNGNYLARIESQTQLNWILDELQCIATTEKLWLGYELDVATKDIILSSGPSQGQVLYNNNDGACVPDLFCPYTPPPAPGPGKRATAFSYVPHFYQDVNAITLDLNTKKFVQSATSSANFYIVQAEYCSVSASQFYRFNFAENSRADSRICTPKASSTWASSVPNFEGNHGVFNDRSFFAGAAHSFVNNLYTTAVTKTLYFDCNCKTDPKINLSCLGSEDFPGCDLYTDESLYYRIAKYGARLKAGINYTYERYKEYKYWDYLYNLF